MKLIYGNLKILSERNLFYRKIKFFYRNHGSVNKNNVNYFLNLTLKYWLFQERMRGLRGSRFPRHFSFSRFFFQCLIISIFLYFLKINLTGDFEPGSSYYPKLKWNVNLNSNDRILGMLHLMVLLLTFLPNHS